LSESPHYHLVPKDLAGNIQFRKKLLHEAIDPEAAQQIRQMCAEDLLFYVNSFCWTYDPRGELKVTPFITYKEFQDEAMLSIAKCVVEGMDFAMPKSRDMGASWMGLTVFEWFWHFQRNLSFLLVSRNEDYVDKRGNPKSLYWKIDFLHQHQPRWLLPTGRWLGFKDPNRKILHLSNADNGSVIDGESTTGDAGRGDRRTAMFIDEHAAFDLNDGFRILRATRDTTRCRGFNSTPQGANNGFYEVVHKTAAKIIRLHWSRHPEKSRGLYIADEHSGKVKRLDDWEGWVDVKKGGESHTVFFPRDYPFELDQQNPRLRSPWYDNECARCITSQEISQELDIDFLGSDFAFFDPRFIDMLRKKYCREPILVGDLEFDRETLQPKRFVENPRGSLKLWITLGADGRPAADRRFVLGSDISAGTGASNSVTVAADRNTGEKIAVWKGPDIRPHPFAELSIALAYFFNKGYMVWDASGPTGSTFTKKVISSNYGYVYHRRIEKKVTQRVTDEPGYYLNAQAREALLEDYRAALSDHKYINRSEQGIAECLQFVRRPGGIEHSASANSQDPSGARTAHGDEVIADALACLGIQEIRVDERGEEPSDPVGSLSWRRKQREEYQNSRKLDCLGEGW